VEDLGSTNGTFVNARRVEGPVPLAPGTTLTVGRVGFEGLMAEEAQ
jgi:pSer/pThr/pTyr-binding forkhead associated (FHA) protein